MHLNKISYSSKTRLVLSSLALIICILADIDLICHSPVPSRYIALRIFIYLLAIVQVGSVGLLCLLRQTFISTLLLLILTFATLCEDIFCHIIGQATNTVMVLIGAAISTPALHRGYGLLFVGVICGILLLTILFSFGEKTNFSRKQSLSQAVTICLLLITVVQLFVIFPRAKSYRHLAVRWKEHRVKLVLKSGHGKDTHYSPLLSGWGIGVTPQIRSTWPGILGDALAITALSFDSEIRAPDLDKKLWPTKVEKGLHEPLADTVVLIIGESSSSAHYGLYGYKVNTTPELNKMYADNKVCFLPQTHSVADMTRIAVLPLISMWSPEDRKADVEQLNLIDLANKQGFKTFWLSGTGDFGIYSGSIGRVSLSSNVLRIADAPYHYGDTSFPYPAIYDDEHAFSQAAEALHDPASKKLIIIHQWGSHFPYGTTYSSSEKDVKTDKVSAYDASIEETDRLVSKFIQAVENLSKEKKQKTLVLFTSDHGEVPTFAFKGLYSISGHYSTNFKGKDYLVPVVAGGTEGSHLCREAETLRSQDGWYSTNMNKYLVLDALGYTLSKSDILASKQTDMVVGADEKTHLWNDYYKP